MKCSDCVHFVRDKIGFGQGIGTCSSFENYKQELSKVGTPMEILNKKLHSAEVKLGIVPMTAKTPVKLLWPDVERVCGKFVRIG